MRSFASCSSFPRPTALTLAICSLLMPGAHAQDSNPAAKADADNKLETVLVTGIRASQQKSLARKRNGDTVSEVVTAEDIGKMPDKNVADTLQKLPGVSTITGAGGQGGYDENDRVSLRGTSPSLALTLINGHGVATADWDPADQISGGAGTSTSGAARSVSYLLFPSEIVSQVIVQKSPQADQAEGGISGSVNIVTRRPLEFSKRLTLDANLQTVYSDMAKKIDPQLSALVNWKNEDNTFGVMLQAFSQERHIRRDSGAEINWARITERLPNGQLNPVYQAVPAELRDKYFIHSAVNTLFEQERKRTGGMIGAELRPLAGLSVNVDAFYSKLDASYTANRLVVRPNNSLNGGVVPTNVTVNGDLITAATFANTGNAMGAQLETQANPKASSQTQYLNGDFKYELSDKLALTGQLGRTEAKGESYLYWNYIFLPNTATAYTFNGMDKPVSFSFPSGVSAANFSALPGNSGADNSFSMQRSRDRESYGKLDLERSFDSGLLASLKGGIRWTAHDREGSRPMKGSAPINAARTGSVTLTTIPSWEGGFFPGNFGSNIGGVGSAGAGTPYISSNSIVAWSDANFSNDPAYNLPVSGVFNVKEDTSAAYGMAKFAGDNWRGDVGLRYVQTDVSVRTNRGVPCGAVTATNGVTYGSQAQIDQCVNGGFVPAGATLFTGSRFGNFIQFTTESSYKEWLPSANFAWDATRDLVLRAGAAKVLSRPDYSALGATVGLGYNTALNPPSTGSGGNPELGANLAWNYNLGAEWYFSKQSLLSAQLFLLDFKALVSSGSTTQRLFNPAVPASAGGPQLMDTLVTAPVMVTGRSQGLELGYQQELGRGFGLQANYAFTDAKETSGQNVGQPMLGSSRDTYTLGGYFENEDFSARMTYSHRSKMRTGLYGGSQNYLAPTGTLSAALNYTVSPHLTLSFEGLNLNNPTLRYYNAATAAVPFEASTGFYNSGRQYYVGLRYKY